MARGRHATITLVGWLVSMSVIGSSCVVIDTGDSARAKSEKRVELAAPLAAGSSFSARTGDGSITVKGVETSECKALAKIVAHARTEERAQELVEQIDVTLEPSGDGLRLVTKGPRVITNAWYSVSIEAQLPVQTRLDLDTSDGSVHVANITGNVDARTLDGSIQAESIKGDVRLRTSDGNVNGSRLDAGALDVHTGDGSIKVAETAAQSCTARTSDGSVTLTNVRADRILTQTNDGTIRGQGIAAARMDCHTSDGSIHIDYAPDAPKALDLTATTSSGGITVVMPPGLSATVEAATDDGSIHTTLPITIQGKVGKSLTGTIGAGEGKVRLRTHDGSITIR